MKLNLVPARTGATWVRSGLQTFAKRPLPFMALFMFFMAVVSLASQLPLVGTVLALMLLPTMTLGLMAAAAAVSEIGAQPSSASLFATAFQAVRSDVRPLAVLGALYAVLFLLVVGISALVDGGHLRGVRGVAVGHFTSCGRGYLDVLRDRLGALGVPVLGGLPVGHERDARSLVLGAEVTLDADAGVLLGTNSKGR